MIPRLLVFTGFGTLFLILETTVLQYIAIDGIVPAFYFLVIIFVAFSYGSFEGIIVGFILGLVFDLSRLGLPGFHSLVFSLFAYLLGIFRGKIQFDLFIIPITVYTLSFLSKFLMTMIFAWIFGAETILIGLFSPLILLEFAYTLLFLVPIFFVFQLINKTFLVKRVYT